MIRINVISQEPKKVEQEFHRYCVIDQNEKKPYTHIFIDKAGQAIEPKIVTRSQNYFSRKSREPIPSRFNAYKAGYVLDIIVKLREENVKLEEIGSVQKFQGQERRVIIISAVRTESVSFLGEPRRFCVAVTQTKVLLVVFVNGKALSKNKLWKQSLKKVMEFWISSS
ncbi:3654_t:CDS:2 [Funneliformis caledonium]|uniref:3654_t:CDS:1 n=1 Tax=Funneliformis caledonium TaxID=1117310 RepID=A0A9N9HC67_9GLOM|nr:3654_t:CDS:2 [Funneliformis caledonium]